MTKSAQKFSEYGIGHINDDIVLESYTASGVPLPFAVIVFLDEARAESAESVPTRAPRVMPGPLAHAVPPTEA